MSYVYPLEGNESAFGSLFDHPDRRAEAVYARDTGKMTLAGPYELSQGGTGLVARNPIYLENGQQEITFWGFSVVVLNVPEVFNKAELENLSDQGYSYRIYRIKPENEEVQIISSNTESDMSEAVEGGLTIIQQKKMMTELANTDPLTGLYNVRYFMTTIKQLHERKQPFGVIYLDLNKFKEVNDQYGHDMGDKVLVEVAVRIEDCLKKEDILFRIGGDEFCIVVMDTNPCAFYHALMEEIVERISRPFTVSDIILFPGISCGYSRYPEDQLNIENLIQEADRNMDTMKNK